VVTDDIAIPRSGETRQRVSTSVRGIPEMVWIDSSQHQENTESASTRLKRLEGWWLSWKRFEALSSLTVSSKRIEAHKIGAEFFFLYLNDSTSTVS